MLLMFLAASGMVTVPAGQSGTNSTPIDSKPKYALGASAAYSVKFTSQFSGHNVNLQLKKTVEKLGESRKPDIKMTIIKQNEAGVSRLMHKAADSENKFSSNSMPDAYLLPERSADYLVLFMCAAGFTPDKNVVVGESFNISWKGSSQYYLEGTGKVLEVLPGKTIRAQLNMKWMVKDIGLSMGDLNIQSIYNINDFQLVNSVGSFGSPGRIYSFEVLRA